MSEGLGPRWALIGPFMTNVLGGGGDKAGFVRILTHLLPAAKVWVDDMKEYAFDFGQDSIKILDGSVQQMLKKYDMEEFQKENARRLVEILKVKEGVPGPH